MKIFIKIVLAALIFTSSFICSSIALDNMPTSKVSVGVVATEIVPVNYKRKDLIIFNVGTSTIYIDNFAVECSTTTAFPLISGAVMSFGNFSGSIWGIVDITTGTVKVVYTQY